MSDPAKYRSKDEVKDMREHHDPIAQVRSRIMERGISEDELRDIDREVRELVNDAAAFAQDAPEPEASELYRDVVVE
jgi:pyruvate dehydrogenase E1 component alpha subunit